MIAPIAEKPVESMNGRKPARTEDDPLTPDEEQIRAEIVGLLSRLKTEIPQRRNAEFWVKFTEKIVDLLSAFPHWDGPVLRSLRETFAQGFDQVKKERSLDVTREYINRWHGWVAEAAFNKMFNSLGVGELRRSQEMDMQGVDGYNFFVDEGKIYIVFYQVKSSQGVAPGIYLVNPQEKSYYQAIDSTLESGFVHPADFVRPEDVYRRLSEGGDITEYCLKLANRHREKFLKRNSNLDPNKEQFYAVVVLAGVGFEPQDEDQYYGWLEVMKLIEVSKDKRKFADALAHMLEYGYLVGAPPTENQPI